MTSQRFFLIFVSLAAMLGGFLFGFDAAVISEIIPFVSFQFRMSPGQEILFVQSGLLGGLLSIGLTGPASDRWGRKPLMLLGAVLILLAIIGCTLAENTLGLITFRFIGGLGMGLSILLTPIYLAENTPAQLRGQLVASFHFSITLGILLAYFAENWVLQAAEAAQSNSSGIMGWIYTREIWRGMFANEAYPACIYLIFLLLIPRSARWLLSKGHEAEGKRIMERLFKPAEVENEFPRALKASLLPRPSLLSLFKPRLSKAMAMAFFIGIFSQICGFYVILYYGPAFLNQAGVTLGNTLGGQVPLELVSIVFTLMAILQIDKWGRKPLLQLGTVGIWISLLALGFLFYFEQVDDNWILTFILLFTACYAFSLGPVQWVVISEIFPTHLRARAVGLSSLALWISQACIVQVFPWIQAQLGSGGAFWAFAALGLPAMYLLFFWFPETQQKTLEENAAELNPVP